MRQVKHGWRQFGWGALGILVGVFGLAWGQDAAARNLAGVQLSKGKRVISLGAGVNARTFAAQTRKGWRYEVRAWQHKGQRWQSLYTRTLRTASWHANVSRTQLCRGHRGRVVVQVAIGRSYRGKWWNPKTRRYESAFVPYQEQMNVVQCGAVPVTTFRRKPQFGRTGALRVQPKAARGASAARYGNAWRNLGQFRHRYGNAWRPAVPKGRYGNAWRGTKAKDATKGRYGNAWRGTK